MPLLKLPIDSFVFSSVLLSLCTCGRRGEADLCAKPYRRNHVTSREPVTLKKKLIPLKSHPNLRRLPDIQVDAADKRDVYAQVSVDPRAIQADENSEVHGSPSRL